MLRHSTKSVRRIDAEEIPDDEENLIFGQTAFLQVADGVYQQFFKKLLRDGGLLFHNPLFTNVFNIGKTSLKI